MTPDYPMYKDDEEDSFPEGEEEEIASTPEIGNTHVGAEVLLNCAGLKARGQVMARK